MSSNSSNYYEVAVDKSTFDGQYSAPSIIVTLSIALALYNSLEMVLLISSTFKRWKGLYFWSLSICNLGVVLYALGIMLIYFRLSVFWVSELLVDSGWLCMIICQSLVLYSRLGLIVDNVKILNAVKWMIIINSIFLGGTTIVLDWGKAYSRNPSFSEAYFYMEHIQMTGFTLQELIISGLYVWKTIGLLRVISKENTRSMIWQLLAINIIIIAMDTALVILQYKHLQLYQEAIKGFVYSVKLKLELNILSKLVDLVNAPSADRSLNLEIIDSNAIPGQAQAEVRHELSVLERFRSSVTTDKIGVSHIEDTGAMNAKYSSSVSGSPDETDEITHPTSCQSRSRGRMASIESEISYADILRSLK